jgi:lycopene beta-cyclase
MLDKPVIIIGGGLWGSLLALRLRQRHPHVRFELYEASSTLGEGLTLSFHQSDISPEAMTWLRPFITHQWKNFQVDFPKFHKSFEAPYCAIHSQAFDQKLKEVLGSENIHLNREITVEEALFDGAFVIDTRNQGYFKAQGYQKSLTLLVKIAGHHALKYPMTVDATVEQKNGFRYLQYLPIDEDTLLVKDSRYSGDPSLYNDYFEEDILNDIKRRGWEPLEVLNREHDFRKVPMDQHVAETSGRVIRLEGFYHDMTGEVLPDAVRLIDRMVETSFRYGELKEVLKNYQIERESKKKVLRTLNKLVYQRATPCHNRYQFMQLLYQLPSSVRQKFYAGDLEIKDVAFAFVGKPIVPLFKLATQVLHLPLKPETNSVSP